MQKRHNHIPLVCRELRSLRKLRKPRRVNKMFNLKKKLEQYQKVHLNDALI